MSVWSWLKLTACLWLLRKMVKVAGWLLLGRPARLLPGVLSDGAPGPGAVQGGR